MIGILHDTNYIVQYISTKSDINTRILARFSEEIHPFYSECCHSPRSTFEQTSAKTMTLSLDTQSSTVEFKVNTPSLSVMETVMETSSVAVVTLRPDGDTTLNTI